MVTCPKCNSKDVDELKDHGYGVEYKCSNCKYEFILR